jgi:uncharacterized protein YigA (DUF484 family)
VADDNGFLAALEREAKVNEVCEEALQLIKAQQAEIERLQAEIERLRAALDGIDRLHDYFNSMDDSSQSICYHCGRPWPCATHLLVEEARRG